MPRTPTRPPTQAALDHASLMKLACRIEDAAIDGSISREAIDELADDAGVDRARLYAAAVLCDDVAIERRHHVQLVFCTGGCQQWGALDRLEHALAARDRDNLPVDVVPRACLDPASTPRRWRCTRPTASP